MDIIKKIKKKICDYEPKAMIFIPQKSEWGELSTNLPALNKEWLSIAEEIKNLDYIIKYEKVGNFLNFFIDFHVIDYLSLETKSNKEKINIEFSSPNPTGMMHLGHLRNTFIGDVLSNLATLLGYEVTREMILNNGGLQVKKFYESVMHHREKILNIDTKYNLEYKGDYVKDIAIKSLNNQLTQESLIDSQLLSIKNTLKKLKVNHEIITYETKLLEDVKTVHNILEKKQLLYKDNGAVFFKSSTFGDNEDRVFVRNNGDYTYFAIDVAYHYNKKIRGFDNQVCIMGEDHIGHVFKLKSALSTLDIYPRFITYATVSVTQNSKQLKMSKRDGTIITIEEILKIYSQEELRLFFLKNSYNKIIDFKVDENNNSLLITFKYIIERIKNIPNHKEILPRERDIFKKILWWNFTLDLSMEKLDCHKIFDFFEKITLLLHQQIQENSMNKKIADHAFKILKNIQYIIGI